MKRYEGATESRLDAALPILARLDGRAFHTVTRTARRPFDYNLGQVFQDTTRYLVQETSALVGYTQSDEITLLWYEPSPLKTAWFDGRVLKMTSILAAMGTQFFNEALQCLMTTRGLQLCDAEAAQLRSMLDHRPLLDARVWNVPSKQEAVNAFIWRERDARKNSISSAAAAYFSPKQLDGKSSFERVEMLKSISIYWEHYPLWCKYGSYFRRVLKSTKFTPEELEKLPAKHAARKNPNLVVERSEVQNTCMVLQNVTNKEAVLFEGAIPE